FRDRPRSRQPSRTHPAPSASRICAEGASARRKDRLRTLIAIPVFNEERHLEDVLREVRQYADDVLVIDDGSTDRTPQIIARLRDELGLDVIQRDENVGYGRSMQDAFDRAA